MDISPLKSNTHAVTFLLPPWDIHMHCNLRHTMLCRYCPTTTCVRVHIYILHCWHLVAVFSESHSLGKIFNMWKSVVGEESWAKEFISHPNLKHKENNEYTVAGVNCAVPQQRCLAGAKLATRERVTAFSLSPRTRITASNLPAVVSSRLKFSRRMHSTVAALVH